MAETPIEAAAREVRLLLVTSGAINDYDAHYSGQKIVKAFLTACLADHKTLARCVRALIRSMDTTEDDVGDTARAVLEALIDE